MTTRDEFEESMARIEAIIYVPGLGADDYSGQFNGFCKDIPEAADHPLYALCPPLLRFMASEDYPDPDEVASALRGCHGFLVQGATPVVQNTPGGRNYSWGYYRTAWLYAASEADIVNVVCDWANGTLSRSYPSLVPPLSPGET